MSSYIKEISPKPRRILFLGGKPLLTSPMLRIESPRPSWLPLVPGTQAPHEVCGRRDWPPTYPLHLNSTPQFAKSLGISTWLISFLPRRPRETKGINKWDALNEKRSCLTKDTSLALPGTVGWMKETEMLNEESEERINIQVKPWDSTIEDKWNEIHHCKTMHNTSNKYLSRGKWKEV